MVVIVIMAVVTGAAVLSISGGSTRALRTEAERLQDALQLAADEAVFEGTQIGVALSPHAYEFLHIDGTPKRWQPLDDRAMRRYAFSSGITLTLQQEGKDIPLPSTTATNAQTPSLLFFSSGEMTAFTITLQAGRDAVSLRTDGANPIQLTLLQGTE